MDKVQRMKQQKQYEDYVKKKTPRHNVWLNMLKAFLLGGTICFLGQVIYHYCEVQKLSADECSSWTSLLLVLISVILTGTGVYPRLAKWGGAGALRLQDLHHRRTSHPVRDCNKLGAGAAVLGMDSDKIEDAAADAVSLGQ